LTTSASRKWWLSHGGEGYEDWQNAIDVERHRKFVVDGDPLTAKKNDRNSNA